VQCENERSTTATGVVVEHGASVLPAGLEQGLADPSYDCGLVPLVVDERDGHGEVLHGRQRPDGRRGGSGGSVGGGGEEDAGEAHGRDEGGEEEAERVLWQRQWKQQAAAAVRQCDSAPHGTVYLGVCYFQDYSFYIGSRVAVVVRNLLLCKGAAIGDLAR